jgi:hypothetical protein
MGSLNVYKFGLSYPMRGEKRGLEKVDLKKKFENHQRKYKKYCFNFTGL